MDLQRKDWDCMRCFPFSRGDKNNETKTTTSVSVPSSCSPPTDHLVRKSGSVFNSQNASDISNISNASSARISITSLSPTPINMRIFTFTELKTATKNFSRSLMIGEGGFGGVYRGVIRDGDDSNKMIDIAVKQLSKRGLQGHKEWVTEVNVLGIVEHPNLVRLLGYCADDDERGIQRLLVYEYMPKRSVQDHLSSRFQAPLPWATRLRIAQDAARGLAYLHEGMEFQIIFRDFKSSNILLDGQWNAKLSDFGLARLGPLDGLSHVSTAVVGTVGYAAPEYIQSGHLTYKSDVWSYGVFLYELITGRRPLDRNRPKGEQSLLEWVRQHLSDMKKFQLIVDPRLDGKYVVKSARKLASIANRCLVRHPKSRPKMSEVSGMMDRLVECFELGIPEASLKHSSCSDAAEDEEEGLKTKKKKRLVDPLFAENRWMDWRSWRPKLVTIN